MIHKCSLKGKGGIERNVPERRETEIGDPKALNSIKVYYPIILASDDNIQDLHHSFAGTISQENEFWVTVKWVQLNKISLRVQLLS